MKTSLTPQEQEFFKCLEGVNPDSIWGLAISKVVADPTPEKFRELVAQLKSQEADAPEVMLDILNQSCYETLLAL